jgi:hypothetical protein
VQSPVGDHILQEFNTLYLTRFRTYKIPRPPKTKPGERGGLRQINTCRKVPLQVIFCWMTTFCIAFYQFNLSRPRPFKVEVKARKNWSPRWQEAFLVLLESYKPSVMRTMPPTQPVMVVKPK